MVSPCGSSLNFLMTLEKTSHYCSFILSSDLVHHMGCPSVWCSWSWVLLQLASYVSAETCHPSHLGELSLTQSPALHKCPGDLRRYLGHSSAMTWRLPRSGGSFGFNLSHFLSLIFVGFDYSFCWLPWPPPSSSLCSCSKL